MTALAGSGTLKVVESRRCVVCETLYAGDERFCPRDGGAIVEAEDAMDPHVGRTIDGRYLVKRLLGRGGMGVVYEADHVGLDRRVAIKFLIGPTDPDAVARFRREARIVARIRHPHVVDIYDVGNDAGLDFLVMEYVEGADLRRVLVEASRLEAPRAIAIARQMLEALDAIHAAGIIHRDIKPSNVVIASSGGDPEVVKLMDFGISKSLRAEATSELTAAGKVVGTPQFMAPEQLLGELVDHRADLYAVGVTLYMMLTGEAPFTAANESALVALQLHGTPLAIENFIPDVAPALAAIVSRALARSPANRFRDARAFVQALDDLGPGTTPRSVRDAPAGDLGPGPTARDAPADDLGPGPTARDAYAERATVEERRRPKLAPEPTPVALAVRRRWSILAGAVAVVLVGLIAVYELRSHGNAPIPGDAGTTAIQHLAYAHAAEDRGELELAIAAYEEAFRVERVPSTLFKIGELDTRLGRRRAAAQAFRRYLDAAPGARDREVVLGRIADLEATPVDAGVVGDAHQESHLPTTQAAEFCLCRQTRAPYTALCPAKVAARCSCRSDRFELLCSKPYRRCEGCDGRGPCRDPRCDLQGFFPCVAPADDGHSRASGDTCDGYATRSADSIHGQYACEVCPDENIRAYRGHRGDACTGFDSTTGRSFAGALDRCGDTRALDLPR